MMAENEICLKRVPADFGKPECITLVLCKGKAKPILLFAEADCELGHQGLLELAIDLEIVDDELQPVGGALLDYKSLAKIRDSLGLGPIDEKILDAFLEDYESRRKKQLLKSFL